MLLGTRRVTAPDGTEWRVSVDWHKAHVRLPSAWRRRRDARKRDPTDWLDPCDCGPADDVVAGLVLLLAFAMVALLLWFLIWPLLARDPWRGVGKPLHRRDRRRARGWAGACADGRRPRLRLASPIR